MLSNQLLDLSSDLVPHESEDVPGSMFLAGVAIGMAPPVAVVGMLLGGGHLAVAGSGCLLMAGVVAAVLSSDR